LRFAIIVTKNQFLIFLVLAFILLVNNWSIPLWDQDEAAYAGFGYMMNETGNWLVPEFMYSDVHRKPPLHFWNIALSYKLFGYNEFAVRFPSFLAILGTFLLVFYQGRKWLTNETAFRGIIVLGGSFLVTAIAKVSVTDATVLFTSTLCAFGLINTLRSPAWKWITLFWIGFGLGVLTKGPPIILFTGTFSALLFIIHPQRMNIFKLHPWFFLPIAVAPAFLWGYLTYLQDGGVFLKWMYDWYVLQRINGEVFGQTGPIGTHLLGLIVFFIPFLMYIPSALTQHAKGFFQKNETASILFSWFIAGWLLYEFSPSKLPAYVIAAHVPLALMIAVRMENGIPWNNWISKAFSSFSIGILLIMGMALICSPFFIALPNIVALLIGLLGSILLAITITLIVYRKNVLFQKLQLGGAILFVLTAWTIAPQITQLVNSSKRVANLFTETHPPETVFICHNFGEQPSLPFYLLLKNVMVNEATQFTESELLLSTQKLTGNAYILNQHQYELICDYYGKKIPYEHVSSLIIDRKEVSDYYIVRSKNIHDN
jgi:4-amino-4-deoxy-L-arabinose transferase-like glycosyltransferase